MKLAGKLVGLYIDVCFTMQGKYLESIKSGKEGSVVQKVLKSAKSEKFKKVSFV